jgi:uncharacterized membrane protein YgcG
MSGADLLLTHQSLSLCAKIVHNQALPAASARLWQRTSLLRRQTRAPHLTTLAVVTYRQQHLLHSSGARRLQATPRALLRPPLPLFEQSSRLFSSPASPPGPARAFPPAAVSRVEEVHNPRLSSPPSFISDAARLLSPQHQQHLSLLLNSLHAQHGAEIAVVTLASISSSLTPRQFAIALFNHWGIGDREHNTGLLLLIVKDARRVELVTGDGVHSEYGLGDREVQQLIVEDRMLPWLQTDEYGMALVEAVSFIDQTVRSNAAKSIQPVNAAALPTAATAAVPALAGGWGGGRGGGGDASGLFSMPSSGTAILAVVMAVFALIIARGASTSQPQSSAPTCKTCNARLDTVGVITADNIVASSPGSLQAMQRADSAPPASPTSSASSGEQPAVVFRPENLYDPDRLVDYQNVLESLSAAQRAAVQAGHRLAVYNCPDCSMLYVQPQSAAEQQPSLSQRQRVPFEASPIFMRGAGMRGADGGVQQRTVQWLPEERQQGRVKGVRREDASGSTAGSSSSGFGGGSSSGGGGGSSF